jgi:hypothetical protein
MTTPAMHRTPNGGFPYADLDLPEPWIDVAETLFRNMLDGIRANTAFSVMARDIDASFVATSRYVNVTGGLFRIGPPNPGYAEIPGVVGLMMPSSTFTYIWIEADGSIQSGAIPDYPVDVIARVTCDASKVTNILDYRYKAEISPAPLRMTGRVVTATGAASLADSVLLCDAAGGGLTLTMPQPFATENCYRCYVVAKTDATANGVIVNAAGGGTFTGPGLAGAASLTLVARTARFLFADGGGYQVFNFG